MAEQTPVTASPTTAIRRMRCMLHDILKLQCDDVLQNCSEILQRSEQSLRELHRAVLEAETVKTFAAVGCVDVVPVRLIRRIFREFGWSEGNINRVLKWAGTTGEEDKMKIKDFCGWVFGQENDDKREAFAVSDTRSELSLTSLTTNEEADIGGEKPEAPPSYACVEVHIHPDITAGDFNVLDDCTQDPKSLLEGAFAEVLEKFNLRLDRVELSSAEDITVANFECRISGTASVWEVWREFKKVLENETSPVRIRGIPLHCEKSHAAVSWPLERILFALCTEFPQHAEKCEKHSDELFGLCYAIGDSAKKYNAVVDNLSREQRKAMELLFETDSWFQYGVTDPVTKETKSVLMSESQGAGLEHLPDPVQAEGLSLKKCLVDAEKAQKSLAAAVGPPEAWKIQPELGIGNKPVASYGSRGFAVDPGIKRDMDRIEQKARRKPDKKGHPTYYTINDLSRMSIVFKSVNDLNDELANILSTSTPTLLGGEVCWLHNRFKDRSAIGYCDVNIGVRAPIGSGRSHICEVQLHLMDLIVAKTKGGGHNLYKQIRETLASWQVEKADAARMQDMIVHTLLVTDGQCARETCGLLRKKDISIKTIIEVMWQSQAEEEVMALGCDKLLTKVEGNEAEQISALCAGARHAVRAAIQRHPQAHDVVALGKRLLALLKAAEKNQMRKFVRELIHSERQKGTNIFGFNIRRLKREKSVDVDKMLPSFMGIG
eukprot:TRINITY_DN75848_c0_g1_i1.p1 TRINITY_DN75848_c0_g1~~TRINITY_DN75848_c0_g1_i1.p1  ORF type:complete len:718 (-),score=118.49 TRINITY_DN75848_c0_g1_i1:51-2204(-)